MHQKAVLLAILLFSASAFGQEKSSVARPNEFVIARHTFFDFGPPFHYYEIIQVTPDVNGTRIERILLTPAANKCTSPATIEMTKATVKGSVDDILGKTNPCAIPEKELRRELKRCKHCLVFSGANVSMQVQCNGQPRLIRSDILDRDMFDPKARTPEHTSWTMELLQRINRERGVTVLMVTHDEKAAAFAQRTIRIEKGELA